MIISHCFTVMVSNQLAFRVPFFRFPNYLRMLCLKKAHLRRVVYCFDPMLFQHANLYFSTIISMRKQKRFVSKQGQPRSRTQLKARVQATLLSSLLPPRNSSYCCFLHSKICFSFANLRNTTLASSLFILLLIRIVYRFETMKINKQ